jgi:hypothetical protein
VVVVEKSVREATGSFVRFKAASVKFAPFLQDASRSDIEMTEEGHQLDGATYFDGIVSVIGEKMARAHTTTEIPISGAVCMC